MLGTREMAGNSLPSRAACLQFWPDEMEV